MKLYKKQVVIKTYVLCTLEGTYSNPQDGYFLLRPSTTHIGNPLTLVLWYKDRVYNVPVRKRSDNRYMSLLALITNNKIFSVRIFCCNKLWTIILLSIQLLKRYLCLFY